MIDYAKFLIEKKVLSAPLYFNLLLGNLGTLAATPMNLAMMTMNLPAGAIWAGAGIGRFQHPIHAMAIASGGHVRVGLEDNLCLDFEKRTSATNADLVERVVRLAAACDRPIATPDEARRMIGLPARFSYIAPKMEGAAPAIVGTPPAMNVARSIHSLTPA